MDRDSVWGVCGAVSVHVGSGACGEGVRRILDQCIAHFKQGDSHSERSISSPFSQPSGFLNQVRPRYSV